MDNLAKISHFSEWFLVCPQVGIDTRSGSWYNISGGKKGRTFNSPLTKRL